MLIYVFRRPIADVLLGDPEDENLVALAGLLSGALLVFKICDITLWLERRPGAFLIADTSRPLLGLVVLTAFLATGSGVEGAMLGTLIGTAAAGIVGAGPADAAASSRTSTSPRSSRSSCAAATAPRS